MALGSTLNKYNIGGKMKVYFLGAHSDKGRTGMMERGGCANLNTGQQMYHVVAAN